MILFVNTFRSIANQKPNIQYNLLGQELFLFEARHIDFGVRLIRSIFEKRRPEPFLPRMGQVFRSVAMGKPNKNHGNLWSVWNCLVM